MSATSRAGLGGAALLIKERAALDYAYSHGDRPWALWERQPAASIA